MKNKKNSLIICIYSICVLLASVIVTLLDYFLKLNFLIHPALNFVFLIFVGYGILVICLGFKKNSPWYFFLSSVLLGLALLYVLISIGLPWWICTIIIGVCWAIFGILSIISTGGKSKTEQVDNKTND